MPEVYFPPIFENAFAPLNKKVFWLDTSVSKIKLYNFDTTNWEILASGAISFTWGSISGTLSNQTDLQTALDAKYNSSNPTGYITASSSDALTNKSGNISQWTNNSGYLTTVSLSANVTGILPPDNGGTGIANNIASTITISGNFATTLTVTAITGITLPTSGILYGTKTGSITSAQLLASMSDPTGTGLSVFATSPTFTTNITTPLILGGTVSGSQLILQGTSGSGTSTVACIVGNVGANGATNAFNVYNDGQFLINTSTRISGSLGIVRVLLNTGCLTFGEVTSGIAGIWGTAAATTPTSSNFMINSNGTTTQLQASTNVSIYRGSVLKVNFSNTFTFSPEAASTGSASTILYTMPASTAQTAGTEVISFDVDGSTNTIQHASNTTIATQRDYVFKARTHRFASATGTITTAATLAITNSPQVGTNAAITTSYALWVQAGISEFDGLVIATAGAKITPRVVSMTDATSFTPTGDTADINTQANTQATGTLTANVPSGTPLNGQVLLIQIKSTNVQTFSWDGIYVGSTTTALPVTTTGGTKTDKFFFQYNTDVSKWQIINAQYGYV